MLSYVTYVTKTFWPARLAVFYPFPAYAWGGGLSYAAATAAWLALTAVTALALVLRRPAPYLLAGWLWYVGTLVPVIGFVQVGDQAYADRYSYFPQIGLLIAVCWGTADLLRAWPRWSVMAAVAATMVLALVSRQQLRVWHDSVSLWEHNLDTAGESPLCLTDLGLALEDVGRRAEAEKCLRRSLELNSKATVTHINLGIFLLAEGRLKEAESEFQFACDYNPGFAHPRTQLAEVYLRMRRFDDAEKWNQEALELQPDLAGAHCMQGMLALTRKKPEAAEAAFREALELQPDFADAHTFLGYVLIQKHQDKEGMAELREAVRCNPHFGEGHLYLAIELKSRGDLLGAEEHFAEACRWSPGLQEGWIGWGRVLNDLGYPQDAARCYQRARELSKRS
jgi:tetratricopeptide (TPR) repeat protein